MKFLFALVLFSAFGLGQAQAQRWGGGNNGWDGQRVRALAHQVDEAADHVHMQAERESDNQWGRDSRALMALHEFAEAAEHFHMQVESYYQDSQHTQQDFYELMNAYRQASRAMHYSRFSDHVMRDWYEAEEALRDLKRYYRWGGGHWNQ